MDLKVRSQTWTGASYEWLKSAMGTEHMQTVTLDLDTFDFATTFTDKVLPSGLVLGKITASGKYGPYKDAGTNEVQTITITGTPTGGTFTLTYSGQSTTAIAYNASAATVEAALEALSNIGPADVGVTGGPGPGTPYVVTFTGDLQGTDVSMITVAHAFTGGTSPNLSVAQTTQGVAGSTDGRGTAVGFLFHTVDCSVEAATDIEGERVASMLVTGFIKESKLPTNHGLDANAKTDLVNWFKFY
jgi:hypothetical protein